MVDYFNAGPPLGVFPTSFQLLSSSLLFISGRFFPLLCMCVSVCVVCYVLWLCLYGALVIRCHSLWLLLL